MVVETILFFLTMKMRLHSQKLQTEYNSQNGDLRNRDPKKNNPKLSNLRIIEKIQENQEIQTL